MKYEEYYYWVPLLGMIMSEVTIQFRMYHLTIVNHMWKIAEIVLIEFPFNLRNMITSICAIHYYNDFGRSFLKQQPRHLRVPESLFPSPQQNVYIDTIDKIVYKAYDYRSISDKANIRLAERRSPSGYAKYSKLKNVETFRQYQNPYNQLDELVVLKYDYVEGTHVPQKVDQMLLTLKEIMELHAKNVVYGDLKLSNCVFNCVDGVYDSVLIDFDFVGHTRYPSTFNTAIDPTDGKRHSTATPNAYLQKEHDVFAFKYLLIV